MQLPWGLHWEILNMINLIPTEEKQKRTRSFYYRLVVVFFVVASFSVLVASIAILPSYFISSFKENFAQAKLEAQKLEPIPILDQQTSLIIKDLNNKLSLIEKAEQNQFLVSQKIINEITHKKMSDIKITQISYENDPVKGRKVSIRGSATNRERLLLFRQALEDDEAFSKVDLPISNFVKGSDIQFYLNLTPA